MYVGRQTIIRRRGMGDTASASFPFADPIPCLSGDGPLQAGQSYCDVPITADVTGSIDLGPVAGGMCFSKLFPWFGSKHLGADGALRCEPVIALPDPWPLVLTWAVGGLVVFKLLRGVTK